MSIELRVRPRRQTTDSSCWWFAMAMILEYYGHFYPDAHYVSPFAEIPGTRPYGPLPSRSYPSSTELLDYSYGRRTGDPVADISEWFLHGIPNNADGLRRFRDLSGFRGIETPAPPGRWTAAHVEEILRRYGPVMFVGQWDGVPHAVVITGISADAYVSYCDPAGGAHNGHVLADFNRLAGRFPTFEGETLNPLYYPSPPQVRGYYPNMTDPPPPSASTAAAAGESETTAA